MSFRDRDWYRAESRRPSFFDNPFGWSLRLGRVLDITVRVHLIFVIYVVVELLRAIGNPDLPPPLRTQVFWWVAKGLFMLFGVVLLHEFGHCLACRRVGGQADEILMWPLGGLAFVAPPRSPRAHLVTTIGGPMVNVGLCVLTGAVLLAAGGRLGSVPLNPFRAGYAGSWVHDLFVVNYILLLFNLLPMYPLDGGRLLQEVLWFRLGYQRSTMLATQAGMVGAVLVGCVGLVSNHWLLIGIAIFAFLTCWQQRQMARASVEYEEAGVFGYDFSRGYSSLEAVEPQRPKRPSWSQRRRQGRWAKRQEQLRKEQEEVDRILAKVSRDGLASLTRRERKTLQRATERQRQRDRELGRVDRL